MQAQAWGHIELSSKLKAMRGEWAAGHADATIRCRETASFRTSTSLTWKRHGSDQTPRAPNVYEHSKLVAVKGEAFSRDITKQGTEEVDEVEGENGDEDEWQEAEKPYRSS